MPAAVPLEPISYLYNTHPLLQSGCLCVLRALCVDDPPLVALLHARSRTPSFSFPWNGALSAFRTLVPAAASETRAHYCAGETMSTRDRRTTRRARGKKESWAERERSTGSFVSLDHVGKRRRRRRFAFFASMKGRISMGVLERTHVGEVRFSRSSKVQACLGGSMHFECTDIAFRCSSWPFLGVL